MTRHAITIQHRLSEEGIPFSEVLIVYAAVPGGPLSYASSRYRHKVADNQNVEWEAFVRRRKIADGRGYL